MQLGWQTALAAALGHFVQIFFIVWRTSLLIPREIHPGIRQVTYAITMGHALNLFFPARAWDVLKCFLLSKGKGRGGAMTVLSAAGVMVADRIVDITALLAIAGIWGAYRHPVVQQWLGKVDTTSMVSLLTGAAILAVLALTLLKYQASRASKWGAEFKMGFRVLRRPQLLGLAFVFALIAWAGEAYSIQVLAGALGLDLDFAGAIFVLFALNLAISVPLSFANLGPFEAAIAISLTSFGMDSSPAFAAAALHHGLQLLVVLLWAMIGLVARVRVPASLPRQ